MLELWSLFDFLMPGFLGTEKQFYQRFGRPIILSRDAKSSSKEQEAGAVLRRSLGSLTFALSPISFEMTSSSVELIGQIAKLI